MSPKLALMALGLALLGQTPQPGTAYVLPLPEGRTQVQYWAFMDEPTTLLVCEDGGGMVQLSTKARISYETWLQRVRIDYAVSGQASLIATGGNVEIVGDEDYLASLAMIDNAVAAAELPEGRLGDAVRSHMETAASVLRIWRETEDTVWGSP